MKSRPTSDGMIPAPGYRAFHVQRGNPDFQFEEVPVIGWLCQNGIIRLAVFHEGNVDQDNVYTSCDAREGWLILAPGENEQKAKENIVAETLEREGRP